MNNNLTVCEQEFFKYLKKEFFLKAFKIKTKISLKEICEQIKDINIAFDYNNELVKDIIIDFVLYKKNHVVCGIEIVDEKEEKELTMGKNLLIDTLFKTMECEYFRVIDLNNLKEAAKIIKNKIIEKQNKTS